MRMSSGRERPGPLQGPDRFGVAPEAGERLGGADERIGGLRQRSEEGEGLGGVALAEPGLRQGELAGPGFGRRNELEAALVELAVRSRAPSRPPRAGPA